MSCAIHILSNRIPAAKIVWENILLEFLIPNDEIVKQNFHEVLFKFRVKFSICNNCHINSYEYNPYNIHLRCDECIDNLWSENGCIWNEGSQSHIICGDVKCEGEEYCDCHLKTFICSRCDTHVSQCSC